MTPFGLDPNPPFKPCEQCKTPYAPARSDARFCSDACRKASKRGVPPLPFDQFEAQLILDVMAAMLKRGKETGDMAWADKAVEIETARYKKAVEDAQQELRGTTPIQ